MKINKINKKIEKMLERRKKEYEMNLKETEILSQFLMNKDKKELVGMIIGMIIGRQIK